MKKETSKSYLSAQEVLDALNQRDIELFVQMEKLSTKPLYHLREDWQELRMRKSEVCLIISLMINSKDSILVNNPYCKNK